MDYPDSGAMGESGYHSVQFEGLLLQTTEMSYEDCFPIRLEALCTNQTFK